jgi:hypothetical protein
MDITLLYFDSCPNWILAHDRLEAAMRRACAVPGRRAVAAVPP